MVTLPQHGPIDSEHIEKGIVVIEAATHEHFQLILHCPDQGNIEYAGNPGCCKT